MSAPLYLKLQDQEHLLKLQAEQLRRAEQKISNLMGKLEKTRAEVERYKIELDEAKAALRSYQKAYD